MMDDGRDSGTGVGELPIAEVVPEVVTALDIGGVAVLQAPPGAGKTTGVPLALLRAGQVQGRILVLEPRRLAARAAAERMAWSLGETVGQRVGYRMRGESKVGPHTRIEVVTEGVLTAMLHKDPELPGVGAVIFDEFHERSLHADLGLALTWDVRGALRDDLKVLVMSATLDAEPVAAMLGNAPVITSAGRSFEVETRWLDRPLPRDARFEAEMAELILRALAETEGGILAFLPGAGEIGRVGAFLEARLPPGTVLHRLFGAAEARAQRRAIAPEAARKVVLATSIAETSLTVPGIRVVVDGGRARRSRHEAGRGMARLVTEPVSRAEADQRRGRAGREAPGVCYRLWAKTEVGRLPPFAPPEIEIADLAPLALDLAAWGAKAGELAFLTSPPGPRLEVARNLLRDLGALDGSGRITDHGRALARVPLHPRLAHMLITGGREAAPIAAILGDRDVLKGAGVDLALRLKALAGDGTEGADRGALARVRAEAKRLTALAPGQNRTWDAGQLAALAFPDRIGRRRKGDTPRWHLSGGSGAVMEADDPLAGASMIVAMDLDGARRDAKVRLAVETTEAAIREVFGNRIEQVNVCEWSRRDRRVIAESREKLSDLVLSARAWRDPPPDALARALTEGLRDLGLGVLKFGQPVEALRSRVEFARRAGVDLPDFSEAGLLDCADLWFAPNALGATRLEDVRNRDWAAALMGCLDWEQGQALNRTAPASFTTPLGRKVAITYANDGPEVAVKLQEVFGLGDHPLAAGLPITFSLLSPAGRPLQVTRDLPGFWKTSYQDVRRDMRGRYPKHHWPEDPAQAQPTTRAKPRKS